MPVNEAATAVDVLIGLRAQGAVFSINEDGKLRVERLPVPLDPAIVELLRDRKEQIIALLVQEEKVGEAARVNLERVQKGGRHLWQMEQDGKADTPEYRAWERSWEEMLEQYVRDSRRGLV